MLPIVVVKAQLLQVHHEMPIVSPFFIYIRFAPVLCCRVRDESMCCTKRFGSVESFLAPRNVSPSLRVEQDNWKFWDFAGTKVALVHRETVDDKPRVVDEFLDADQNRPQRRGETRRHAHKAGLQTATISCREPRNTGTFETNLWILMLQE